MWLGVISADRSLIMRQPGKQWLCRCDRLASTTVNSSDLILLPAVEREQHLDWVALVCGSHVASTTFGQRKSIPGKNLHMRPQYLAGNLLKKDKTIFLGMSVIFRIIPLLDNSDAVKSYFKGIDSIVSFPKLRGLLLQVTISHHGSISGQSVHYD